MSKRQATSKGQINHSLREPLSFTVISNKLLINVVKIDKLDQPETNTIRSQKSMFHRPSNLMRISEENSEQNDKFSERNFSSKSSKEVVDFSFLKPITTKKKVLGLFS